jgi:hypothetical protein
MKNFRLPLPEITYTQLRVLAEKSRVPATALAREAIDQWLRKQARRERHSAVAAYAAAFAGTPLDLDPDLEAAAFDGS